MKCVDMLLMATILPKLMQMQMLYKMVATFNGVGLTADNAVSKKHIYMYTCTSMHTHVQILYVITLHYMYYI